jgi:uncharacterized protein
MSATIIEPAASGDDGLAGGVDCDVHPAVPGMAALLPYLDDHWREQVVTRGIDGLDSSLYPPAIPANGRPDWRGTGKPGSDLARLRREALDDFGSDLAICNCLYGVQAVFNPDMGAALARAVNDWLATEWLDREPRLRGSIVVSLQDVELAAAEIERCAADPRFVQVLLLAMGEAPLGRRQFWPVYRAAARHDLPIGIHAGSTFRHATTSNGWPSLYAEDEVSQAHGFQAQLLSLIAEGVFAQFRGLRVVLIESGVTWLPNFLWRMGKTWRAMRAEVPWVQQPPAELVRERIRFTLQPVDSPPEPGMLEQVIDQIGTDRALLFSTDYPHWHFDGQACLPQGIPPALVRRMRVDNPLETYPRLQRVLS